MSKATEVKYRAWNKKLQKMKTVITVSFDEQYVTCKDNPKERVSFSDIELLRHMGIAGENRKGIYEGDIVSFEDCDDYQIMMVVRHNNEWYLQMPKTGKELPFPWNSRNKINVLGNRFENEYYLSDEYARDVRKWKIQEVLSSHDICENKLCRHDLERAIEGLADLTKEELIEMIKSLTESLRDYKKSYFEECSRNRHR